MRKNILIVLLLSVFVISCNKGDETGRYEYKRPAVKSSEFTDTRDNQTYKCIEVNGQVWMAENFRYIPKANSIYGCYTYHEEPPSVTRITTASIKSAINFFLVKPLISIEIRELIIKRIDVEGASAQEVLEEFEQSFPQKFYDRLSSSTRPFDEEYYAEYGLLYTYKAAQRYAPEGWRVPTDEDWNKLEESIGMPKGEISKLDEWRGEGLSRALKEDDEGIGFNVKYAGARMQSLAEGYGTKFFMKGAKAYYWSSSEVEYGATAYCVTRIFYNRNDAIMKATSPKLDVAYSVRYIKK